MSLKLWEASKKIKQNSKLFAFENFVSEKLNKRFYNNYEKIHKWSVKKSQDFWDIFWDFSETKGIKGTKKIIRSKVFYKNIFLPQSKLNFGENLLCKNNFENFGHIYGQKYNEKDMSVSITGKELETIEETIDKDGKLIYVKSIKWRDINDNKDTLVYGMIKEFIMPEDINFEDKKSLH